MIGLMRRSCKFFAGAACKSPVRIRAYDTPEHNSRNIRQSREDPQQIGQITADAYCRFRDSLGLPPVSEYDIDETKIDALVPKIVSEIFAGLTPVTVDEAAARTLLKETLQR